MEERRAGMNHIKWTIKVDQDGELTFMWSTPLRDCERSQHDFLRWMDTLAVVRFIQIILGERWYKYEKADLFLHEFHDRYYTTCPSSEYVEVKPVYVASLVLSRYHF
jgi:hypothetical protein